MRTFEVERAIQSCVKCTICYKSLFEICPIYEEFGIPPFSPPGIFYLADGIASRYVKMSPETATVPFACNMCGACSKRCISGDLFNYDYPTELIEGIREQFVEAGELPEKITEALTNFATSGNAWRLPNSKRVEWEKDSRVTVPDYAKEQNEYLLFIGDASLIEETHIMPKAIAKLLRKGGVDFGTLKEGEVDSGNEARELGESGLFEELARVNIETFKRLQVKKIITISPHDYNTFCNDYPKLGMKFEKVYHYTEIISDLIKEGKIEISGEIPKTVTFEDPCHLGRYNGIYEAPREIIKAIPGVKFVEMQRNFDESFCCGGGGGRMWYDPDTYRKQRISDIRVRHAKEAGADIIATACPYCLSMLKGAGNLGDISVKDVGELAMESMSMSQ